jgi:hypothetical protein
MAATISAAALSGTTIAATASNLIPLIAMTKANAGLLASIITASLITALVVHQRTAASLHSVRDAGTRQAADISKLQSENERLAMRLDQATDANAQLADIPRLRAETAALRNLTNDLRAAQAESLSLRAAMRPAEADPQTAAEVRAKLSFNKNWILAFHLYASRHQDHLPESFAAAESHFPANQQFDTSVGTNEFEIVYRGRLTDITNAANTIVIREIHPRRTQDGKWSKTYGFADGHSELHLEVEPDFGPFEQTRIIPAPDSTR